MCSESNNRSLQRRLSKKTQDDEKTPSLIQVKNRRTLCAGKGSNVKRHLSCPVTELNLQGSADDRDMEFKEYTPRLISLAGGLATWSAAQHAPVHNFLEKKFHDCNREAQ
jgi:hypothetical protein